MEKEQLIKIRDTFLEIAEVADEILNLMDREEKGEDVTKESEAALGRFMFKFIQLQQMK